MKIELLNVPWCLWFEIALFAVKQSMKINVQQFELKLQSLFFLPRRVGNGHTVSWKHLFFAITKANISIYLTLIEGIKLFCYVIVFKCRILKIIYIMWVYVIYFSFKNFMIFGHMLCIMISMQLFVDIFCELYRT